MNSLDISASGMTAQRVRLDLIANNIANAETTRVAGGKPGEAYQRIVAVFQANEDGGVDVKDVVQDQTPGKMVYNPGHPDASKEGYVQMPNVNAVTEMVDMVVASRAYEANVTAINASKSMTRKALDIGKG
ncbi:MAG: flagellar basal body rod protein FlgC [bacterium]